MRVGQVSVKNFQSFPALDFDYSDLGLALLSGETGAGKSTLLDAISWILFGISSKEFSADDVRSWDASGPTEGSAYVQTPTGTVGVYRVRHPGKNDLYWTEQADATPRRGKDLVDTQRLLEARLGVTASLFLTGSYLSQFSRADSFFIAKAKERRDVLEQIADQEFAISLGEKTSEARKVAKKEAEALQLQLARESGKLEAADLAVKVVETDGAAWDVASVDKILELQRKLESFDQDKAHMVSGLKAKSEEWEAVRWDKFNALSDWQDGLPTAYPDSDYTHAISELASKIVSLKSRLCKECGGPFAGAELEQARSEHSELLIALQENRIRAADNDRQTRDMEALKSALNPHLFGLQQAQNQVNPYGEQIIAAQGAINPYLKRQEEASTALQSLMLTVSGLQDQLQDKNTLVSQLGWLYDKSFEMRALLMARVVSQIESQTNSYLEKYFDAALRVKFSLADSDKLEVEILNGGHAAPFRALSGGERCMLKLCFSLSLMKAAQDKAGVEFGMIMLDEPTNGLDSALKIKAYALLQLLEQQYGTVLVIEHDPALKAEFYKVFTVSKAGGHSEVHEVGI